jgi:hypothetical protein
MAERLRYALQHHLNSLHVYCKVRRILSPRTAIRVSRAWERIVHPIIYWKRGFFPEGKGARRISASDS